MNHLKKIAVLISILVAAVTLVACQNTGILPVGFETRTLVLEVGDTETLSLNNESNVALTELVFESQDSAVVTVSTSGVVTAVGAGFTAVSVTHESTTDYVIVSVVDPLLLPKDGKEVSIRVNSGYIQWQYVGNPTWTNIVALESLIGPNGTNGTNGMDGQDGDQVEFRVDGGQIQWKYVGGTEWTNLLSLTSITGADGDQVELQVSETHIQWKLTKDSEWSNLIALSVLAGTNGTNGVDGVDGKEVEIQNNGTYIQWRYVGDEVWTNLALVEDLKGEQGVSVVDAYFDTDYENYDWEELDVDMYLYYSSSINTPYFWQRAQVFSPSSTDLDDENQIEEQVSEADTYTIYYSGYGTDAYQESGFGNDYGYEYIRIEGTLSQDLTLTLSDFSGERPAVEVKVFTEANGLISHEILSNWTSVDGGEGETDIIDAYTLTQGMSDVRVEIRTLPLEVATDTLVFELSNGEEIRINYTEMYEDSQTYGDLLDYIDDLHQAVRAELLNTQVLEVLKLQFDMYDQLLTALYNSTYTSDFESYDLGLNNYDSEAGYFVRELSAALAFQYFYEMSMENEIGWDENSTMMNAFQVLFGEDFYFLEEMFGFMPSYELAYGLNLSYVINWDTEEEIYFGEGDYLPLTPLIEYLTILSKYDESSFYQYLTLNPNTDWDFNSFYDRYQYITKQALDSMDYYIYVDFDPLGLGIELGTTNYPYYYYDSNNWVWGGEEGVYHEDFNYHYFQDLEFAFGRMFPTIDLTHNIYELDIYSNGFNAYVNYGTSFPLPKQSAFTNGDYYTINNGDGGNRYFKLEGYTYSNEYLYSVDNFYNVAYGSWQDNWHENYYSFDGSYGNPFDDGSELNFEAVWVEYFLVNFYDNEEGGDPIKSEYVRIGGDATAPNDPSAPTGYEFNGWNTNYYDVYTNLDVYPIFDPIVYNITYLYLGTSTNAVGNPTTYTNETPTITLTSPSNIPTDYEFNGWFDANGNEITQITTGSYGDITLYADIDLITYYITYNLNGGDDYENNPYEFNTEDLDITLVDAYKTGYTFEGWFSDSNFTNEVTSISTTGDKTLYAKFTINKYTISFDTAGGSTAPSDITQDYKTYITAPNNPDKNGYIFTGWKDQNGNSFSFTTMPAYDVYLTAQWDIEEYTITFQYSVYNNSNVTIETQEVEYGSNATFPADPVLAGYNFTGWTGSVDNITSDRTVTANFTAMNYLVTVSVVEGEGSVQFSGRPNIDRTITITATPESGFAFSNWVVYYYDSNNVYQTVSVESSSSPTTTFFMPAFDVVIEAYFDVQVYNLAWSEYGNNQNDELTHGGTIASMLNVVGDDIWENGGYDISNYFTSWNQFFSLGGTAVITDSSNNLIATITSANYQIYYDSSSVFSGSFVVNLTYET